VSASVAVAAAHSPYRSLFSGFALPAIAFLVLGLAGPVLSPYLSELIGRMLVLAIFALSLELLVGMTGLVSLGHSAFIGIGAYATVLASGPEGRSIASLLPLAMGCAAMYALVVGALCLRTRGVYFIMVTLAFAQMAYFVFHDSAFAGGSDGLYLAHRPYLGAVTLENGTQLFYAELLSLAATYALLALVRRSRFGAALAGIRANEQRMRAAGFATFAYQLAAFVLAAALAGLAGFLVASRDGVVSPDMMGWHVSGEILVIIILGGLGHLRGAVLGAVAFTLLKEFFSSESFVGPLAGHWQLTLGLTIIAFVVLLPGGLVSLGTRMASRRPT